MTFFAFFKTLIIIVLVIVVISAVLIFQFFKPNKKKKDQEKLDRILKETEAIAQIEDPFKRAQKYEKFGMINKAFENYQQAAKEKADDIHAQVKFLDYCIKEEKEDLIIDQYNVVLNLTPDDHERRHKFIKRLMETNHLDVAEKNCLILMEKKPNEKKYILQFIELYIRLERYEDVELLCENLLNLDKYSIELKFEVAEIYFIINNVEKALENFRFAYEKVPTNVKYQNAFIEALFECAKLKLKEKEYETVIDHTNELMNHDKENYEYLLLAGKALNASGDYNSALVKLRLAKAMRPDDTDVVITYAEILFNKNNSTEALKILKKASLDKPKDYKLRYAYGVFSGEAGMIDVAAKELEAVVKLKDDFDEAHYNLAVAFEALGEIDKAIDEYKATLRINQQHVEARANLELLLPSELELMEDKSEEQIQQGLEIAKEAFDFVENTSATNPAEKTSQNMEKQSVSKEQSEVLEAST